MGRPIGSANRQKPFTDMLRLALLSGGGRRLRIIADKLVEKAEQGDLQAIREVIDRLDGKSVQAVERNDLPIEAVPDSELLAIIRTGSRELLDEPNCAGLLGQPENAAALGTKLGTDSHYLQIIR
jgi:hypothetical protein